MSINTNRARTKLVTTNREYRRLWLRFEYPPYWDEGLQFNPIYRGGFKNPNKRIRNYQRRMYRSWKYNRKNQWKE